MRYRTNRPQFFVPVDGCSRPAAPDSLHGLLASTRDLHLRLQRLIEGRAVQPGFDHRLDQHLRQFIYSLAAACYPVPTDRRDGERFDFTEQ